MESTIWREIRDNEKALMTASHNALEAWIAGNIRERDKWDHWADRIEAHVEYLYSVAYKGA